MNTIVNFLNEFKIEFNCNYDTSKLSHIKAGGRCCYLAFPVCGLQLVEIVRYCVRYCIRFLIIGAFSNTLIADEGFDGIIISTSRIRSYTLSENSISVDCGAYFRNVNRALINSNKVLLTELHGIPGTIGGMVRNNAGAFGKSISDIFIKGSVYDIAQDRTLDLNFNEMGFSYRKSFITSGNYVLLNAVLRVEELQSNKSKLEIEYYRKLRIEKQPTEPSLGSFFKRDGNVIPAKIIDELGLKGLSVGGASVSHKHSGFIINKGNASAENISTLAKMIEDKVYSERNIILKREAEIIH